MTRALIAFPVLMLAVVLCTPAWAEKLDRFEDQFDREGAHSAEKTSNRDRENDYIERENPPGVLYDHSPKIKSCDDITNLLGCILGQLIFAPFQAAIEGTKWPLSSYPYQHEPFPFLLPMGAKDNRSLNVTTSLAYQWVSSDVRGVMTDLRVRSRYRVGGRLNYIYYNEDQDSGNDHLNFLAYSLNIVPGEGDQYMIDLAFGGVALLGDETKGGPSFSIGALIFPVKPLIVELRAGVAMIRYQALWDFSAEVGGNVGRVELFAGYRSLMGPIESIGGPYLGARVWF